MQNEPDNDARWEARVLTPKEEADFLGFHLGLALLEGHPEMKIFGYDHNKDHVLAWADALYSHAAASKFMSGIAFHWYAGGGFDAIERIHEQHPDTIKEEIGS